jgi:hypothetical protein
VAQDHQRPFALLSNMEVDAVRLDHAMRHSAALPVNLIELEDGITSRRCERRYEFALHLVLSLLFQS